MLAIVLGRCVKDSSRPPYTLPPHCLPWKGTGGDPPPIRPAQLRPSPLPPPCPDSAALHPSRPGATPSHQLSHLAPIVFSPILPPANNLLFVCSTGVKYRRTTSWCSWVSIAMVFHTCTPLKLAGWAMRVGQGNAYRAGQFQLQARFQPKRSGVCLIVLGCTTRTPAQCSRARRAGALNV